MVDYVTWLSLIFFCMSFNFSMKISKMWEIFKLFFFSFIIIFLILDLMKLQNLQNQVHDSAQPLKLWP